MDTRQSMPPEATAKIEELEAENRLLSLRVKALERELYGSRADRRKVEDPNQTTFAEVGEAPAPEPTPPGPSVSRRKERKGKKKGPNPLNPDLPRVEERVADPDLKELICPVTGAPMKPVFEEKIEVLARKPAEYYVKVFVRRVFAPAQGDAMAYSPWPASVMPRIRIDASVVGSILCARFADHQPYNRQSEQLKRHGVDLARNTICSIVRLAEEKLESVYKAVVRQTLASGYLMMDPTPVRLQSERKKGSTKEACLWTYRALDGPVFFEFAEGKHGTTPAKTLEQYKGILQTDGASNFGGVPARPDITHMNCWAHLRRYFLKAEEDNAPGADGYVNTIDRLFHRERIIRRLCLKPESALELRRRFSLPEVDALFARARDYAQNERMVKMPMPKAVKYLLGRTAELRECFLHAPSRIDNNLAENALRPIKLGAKNWLFIGHEKPDRGPRPCLPSQRTAACSASIPRNTLSTCSRGSTTTRSHGSKNSHPTGGSSQRTADPVSSAVVSQMRRQAATCGKRTLTFAAHYGTVILPSRHFTPTDKGKVEAGVRYVKNNALKGKSFSSLAEVNEHLRWWTANVADKRIHGTTKRQVGVHFEEFEKAALKPLPDSLFPSYEEGHRGVHRDSYIELNGA